MRHWSLLLTGLFASASVVVTTQVQAQKAVQVQKLVYTKALTVAGIAINRCYVYKYADGCAKLSNIKSALIQRCGSGDKIACNSFIEIGSMERSAIILQSLDSIRF